MIPVLNYPEAVTDEHALLYGAALLGLSEEDYFEQLCAIAYICGAEKKLA